jgi:hypothetical protein
MTGTQKDAILTYFHLYGKSMQWFIVKTEHTGWVNQAYLGQFRRM